MTDPILSLWNASAKEKKMEREGSIQQAKIQGIESP